MFPLPQKILWRIIDPTIDNISLSCSLIGKLTRLSQLREKFRRFGVQPVEILSVPIDKLHALRAVRCEVIQDRNKGLLEFLERQFKGPDHQPDWSIGNSMHCQLYDAYLSNKMPKKLEDLNYWKWHVSLDLAGINRRPPEWIRIKINKALALLDSIKQKGFDDRQLRNLPWVLDRPLISTRYQVSHSVDGYEIYDGHHRVAALCSLGYQTMKVLLVRDVATCTPFGVPLEEILDGS